MIKFHLNKNTFDAIICRGQRDIIVSKQAIAAGDRVNLCCDDYQLALSATIELVEYSKNAKHADIMTIIITDVEEIDYARTA